MTLLMLLKLNPSEWVVTYPSQNLNQVECNYYNMDKELLVVRYLLGGVFWQYLLGREFCVRNDLQAKVTVKTEGTEVLRYVSLKSCWHTNLVLNIGGKKHAHADRLWRCPNPCDCQCSDTYNLEACAAVLPWNVGRYVKRCSLRRWKSMFKWSEWLQSMQKESCCTSMSEQTRGPGFLQKLAWFIHHWHWWWTTASKAGKQMTNPVGELAHEDFKICRRTHRYSNATHGPDKYHLSTQTLHECQVKQLGKWSSLVVK